MKQLTVSFDIDVPKTPPKAPVVVKMDGIDVGMVTGFTFSSSHEEERMSVRAVLNDAKAIDLVTTGSVSGVSFVDPFFHLYTFEDGVADRKKLKASVIKALAVLGLEYEPPKMTIRPSGHTGFIVRLFDSHSLGMAFENRRGKVYSHRVKLDAAGRWQNDRGLSESLLEYGSDEGLVLAILTAMHH